jgi:hypothetical protein
MSLSYHLDYLLICITKIFGHPQVPALVLMSEAVPGHIKVNGFGLQRHFGHTQVRKLK